MEFDFPLFLDRHAPLSPVPGVEGVVLHQARDVFGLWMAWEEETNTMCPVPFWAAPWPASVLLARHVQKNPSLVKNKTVLDLGCGCGLASVVCARTGARRVIANDIDPVALEVAAANAQANGVLLECNDNDLLAAPAGIAADVVLVADLFYTQAQAEQLMGFLWHQHAAGAMVIISDGGRPFAPREGVRELARETMVVNRELEGVGEREVRILEYTGIR
jgi:predicted nicotinamide N-methyase